MITSLGNVTNACTLGVSSCTCKPAASAFALVAAKLFTENPMWSAVEPLEPPLGPFPCWAAVMMKKMPGNFTMVRGPAFTGVPPRTLTMVF